MSALNDSYDSIVFNITGIEIFYTSHSIDDLVVYIGMHWFTLQTLSSKFLVENQALNFGTKD